MEEKKIGISKPDRAGDFVGKHEMSWDEYTEFINVLYKQIKQEGYDQKTDVIMGIAKGGVVPAVHLANITGMHYIACDTVLPYQLQKVKKVFLVDDIADTGGTLKRVIQQLKSVKKSIRICTAVIVYRNTSKIVPNCYSFIWPGNEWFIFPWEVIG